MLIVPLVSKRDAIGANDTNDIEDKPSEGSKLVEKLFNDSPKTGKIDF